MEQNMTEKRKGTDREDLVVILFGILLAWLIYQIVLKELPETLSDYNGHTYVYLPMFNRSTWFQGWKTVPYCLWHLCVLGLNHILRIYHGYLDEPFPSERAGDGLKEPYCGKISQ